ncbi:colicin transporter [Bifidobacterium breve]|uniref:colicin transporter n=1 Tax=Bifidobacterium breve TaxID=1685 RepID=UPI003D08BD7C
MTKPSEEVETMDDATPEESKPKGIKPAKLTAIIIAVVVVALAGIGGGYAYWTHHEGNAYHEAVAQAENADKALSKAVDEATATTYKADQLKEPKLLDKLDDAIRKAKALKGIPEDRPGEWLAWRLASARKANATDADEANAQAKALDAALKAVRDSKLAKELDTAKDQLRQGIDGAGQTLRDTDGKVADNATRDSLTKAIDEANSTLSKKGVTDPKTYTDAKAKLDAAVRQVTDSKAAKEQADAEAAAQAQAQAQAAAQSQRSYSQSYNRYGGSGSGYSSNRGYSAPQQSYTAPQQSYSGGSSGGSSLADLIGAASSGNTNEKSTGNYAPIEH